ncbi:MAG: hypothetical protein ISR59_10850 [Anaerolineales bacterium]|uniref:Uncharacterized protein n=1 Tax=Candidatus Desulfolinea nitratireducens TaxID=2841698 RepID=A0A8J6NJK6_9CHLR|nr:hypothetical protein [Candidatus Desulfolinea nitratireducens]MBL6961598.1 hypothetical protein [Anaerolineales bacterium]
MFSKPINLLVGTRDTEFFEAGAYRFVNDAETLAKGVIEVLYLLRNSLFHGEIVPNNDAQHIYAAAYHILHELVQAL